MPRVKVDGAGRMVIPADLRKRLGLDDTGGVVDVELEPDHLAIRPLRDRQDPEEDEHGLLVLDVGRAVTADEVADAVDSDRDQRD